MVARPVPGGVFLNGSDPVGAAGWGSGGQGVSERTGKGVVGGATGVCKQIETAGVPGVSAGKASPCHAGDAGSVPGLGRSPRERNGTHSSILAWRIPWTDKSGGFGAASPWGRKESDMTE